MTIEVKKGVDTISVLGLFQQLEKKLADWTPEPPSAPTIPSAFIPPPVRSIGLGALISRLPVDEAALPSVVGTALSCLALWDQKTALVAQSYPGALTRFQNSARSFKTELMDGFVRLPYPAAQLAFAQWLAEIAPAPADASGTEQKIEWIKLLGAGKTEIYDSTFDYLFQHDHDAAIFLLMDYPDKAFACDHQVKDIVIAHLSRILTAEGSSGKTKTALAVVKLMRQGGTNIMDEGLSGSAARALQSSIGDYLSRIKHSAQEQNTAVFGMKWYLEQIEANQNQTLSKDKFGIKQKLSADGPKNREDLVDQLRRSCGGNPPSDWPVMIETAALQTILHHLPENQYQEAILLVERSRNVMACLLEKAINHKANQDWNNIERNKKQTLADSAARKQEMAATAKTIADREQRMVERLAYHLSQADAGQKVLSSADSPDEHRSQPLAG